MNPVHSSDIELAGQPLAHPLTPPDCDLTDFPHMQLDVARLRNSDMALSQTPDACWSAVLLWSASWHQIPAASLPDDDCILSNLAGYGRVVREWRKVKAGALHGWVKCGDGRLYHKVVADKANKAWEEKLRQRWMTECARIRKHADRHGIELTPPTFEEWKAAGRPVGHALPISVTPETTPNCPDAVPQDNASQGNDGHTDVSCDSESKGSRCHKDVACDIGSKGEREGEGEGYREEETPLTPQGAAPDGAGGGKTFPTLDDEDLMADQSSSLINSADPVTLADPIADLPPSAGTACTTVGAACLAMKAAGISDTAPGNPKLRALIDAGAELSEFLDAAQKAVASGNARYSYVLGIVAGERQRAAELVKQLHVPPLSSRQGGDRLAQRPHVNKQIALEQSNKAIAAEWVAEQQALRQQGVTA